MTGRGGDTGPLLRLPIAVGGARRGLGMILVAGPLACSQPPDYPADADHLSATTPRTCYDCHHLDTSPPMHPSHFDEAGILVEDRQVCHNCHQAQGAKTTFER